MNSPERRLEALIQHPMESLDIEIKDWLKIDENNQKADLVKAILALANHGGGYVIIGFREVSGIYQSTHTEQEIVSLYDQDRINSIVSKYADPPFHVECHLVQGESEIHPVIVVPGGHSVPIRCARSGPEERHVKQNAYYIRRPGPASEEPQSAKEWSDLIRRCIVSDKENLVESLRSILNPAISVVSEDTSTTDYHNKWTDNVEKRFSELNLDKYTDFQSSPFKYGYWFGVYTFFPKVNGITLSELNSKISLIESHETGWPIGIIMSRDGATPYAHDDCIEAWLGNVFDEPDSADFWKLSPNGKFATFRGYQEDSNQVKRPPGTVLDFIIPIWRVAEFLLHGYRFAREFNIHDVSMQVTFKWSGLKGRALTTSSERYFSPRRGTSVQDSVSSNFIIEDISSVETNLADYVEQITRPLYEIFNFFSVPKQTIINEIKLMRKGI